MAKRQKLVKCDGLGPYEIKRIRAAIRKVWEHCHARALVKKRCLDKAGFSICEKCKARTPALKVDHIKAVGVVDGGFIARLFVSSKELQGLCKDCHDLKTAMERNAAVKKLDTKKKKSKCFTDEF